MHQVTITSTLRLYGNIATFGSIWRVDSTSSWNNTVATPTNGNSNVIYGTNHMTRDRLCGLVVRVLGYRSGGPCSISCTTRMKRKVVGLERGPLSLEGTTEQLLDRKVAAV
jgi:hypothetical protein